MMEEFFERLAEIEHERWADWQRYLHSHCTTNDDGSLTIPADLVERWNRQIATPYGELTETEKGSDREQVHRYWALIQPEHAVASPDPQETLSSYELNVRLLAVGERIAAALESKNG